MGNIGVPELIFIFVLALLIFGPRKLPELGRTLGKALAEFRRASTDMRMAMEQEMRELERHAQELEKKAGEAVGLADEPAEAAIGAGSIEPRVGAPGSPASAALPGSESQPEVKPADGDAKRA